MRDTLPVASVEETEKVAVGYSDLSVVKNTKDKIRENLQTWVAKAKEEFYRELLHH